MKQHMLAIVLVAAVLLAALDVQTGNAQDRAALLVSTTTSLFDTGLLDVIEHDFESRYPIDIRFIAVGTGIAIQQAERGDVDCSLSLKYFKSVPDYKQSFLRFRF